MADAERSITTANDDRDRIQLHFNELTRTVQTVQRDRDEARAELDRMRAAITTQESEFARLRTEALVSQQTIDTLRRQMPTTIATHGAPTQEQQRGMQPPAHLPNYSLASMGTPFRGRTDTPISGYDSRPPNYSYVGSLPGRDWTPETPSADSLRAIYDNEGGRQGPSNKCVVSICLWTRS